MGSQRRGGLGNNGAVGGVIAIALRPKGNSLAFARTFSTSRCAAAAGNSFFPGRSTRPCLSLHCGRRQLPRIRTDIFDVSLRCGQGQLPQSRACGASQLPHEGAFYWYRRVNWARKRIHRPKDNHRPNEIPQLLESPPCLAPSRGSCRRLRELPSICTETASLQPFQSHPP